jgi:hypothetical protein
MVKKIKRCPSSVNSLAYLAADHRRRKQKTRHSCDPALAKYQPFSQTNAKLFSFSGV